MHDVTGEQVLLVRERVGSRRVVASISGGKDSAALSLHLKELGIEHDRVFMDTGWEADATYDYLRGELPRVIGPITWLHPPRKMEELVRHKAMCPSRQRRFCTEELKVKPMQRHLKTLVDAGHDPLNVVGIRHGESAARAKMPEWEWSDSFDCEVWRPLVHWTEQDVVDIHKRHGLIPNPLYLMGATRVGCWPCIFARKAEIRLIADKDPDRINRLRVLEHSILPAAERRYAERYAERGETLESLGYQRPAWFQSPLPTGTTDADGKRHRSGEPWPIDKVVEWSRTSRGGKQFEMFAASPADEGCMRWGMCEHDEVVNG